ncbi:MAG: TIGR00296 family protein [Candidatus Aenigmarchaeota archaeon]|nr:TIGR00296 family protein [Candidatus Aenigmarchaeota archaeon]
MNASQGEFAVKLARKALEAWTAKGEMVKRPDKISREFLDKSGVFTTLHTYPERELRGCIGFPTPVMPLVDAIIESAVSAAQDPRFPDLEKEELKKIIVEVSILTKPQKINAKKPEDYAKKIIIGRDGLIIRKGFHSGLLLPQVATEYGWDARTFLEHLCMKASLPSDAWLSPATEIFSFHSEIFSEKKPNGKIEKT